MKIAFVWLAAAGAPCFAQQTPPAPAQPPVKLELITDTVQIAAGSEFDIGARITLADGVRIGWQNPGDTGTPTTAKLEAPPGFEVTGPFFPAPRTFELPYGLAAFGYEHETVLFFHVKAPSDLAESQRVPFTVDVGGRTGGLFEVSGQMRAQTLIASYPLRDEPAVESVSAMARHRATLAKHWKELEKASVAWSVTYNDVGEGLGLELALEVEGADAIEYFPTLVAGLDCGARHVAKTAKSARTVAVYAFIPETKSPPPDARGVLRVERGGVNEYFDVRATRPTPLSVATR